MGGGKGNGKRGWGSGWEVRFMAFDLHFYDATELACGPGLAQARPRHGPLVMMVICVIAAIT